jgi:hypothetical protein
LSLFSPRVSICLFFRQVFVFVSFFTRCLSLSLFSPCVYLCVFDLRFFFITSWHQMPFTLHTVAMPEFWVHGVPSNQWCD